MKILLLSVLLALTSSIGHSQDTIMVYSKQWAGGYSYSYGNDISVYFPIQETSVNVDSVQLFIQGMTYKFTGNLLMDFGKVCSHSFGWRSSFGMEGDNRSFDYYGIESKQVGTTDSLNNHAIFYYSNGTKSESVVNYSEEYLAYP